MNLSLENLTLALAYLLIASPAIAIVWVVVRWFRHPEYEPLVVSSLPDDYLKGYVAPPGSYNGYGYHDMNGLPK